MSDDGKLVRCQVRGYDNVPNWEVTSDTALLTVVSTVGNFCYISTGSDTAEAREIPEVIDGEAVRYRGQVYVTNENDDDDKPVFLHGHTFNSGVLISAIRILADTNVCQLQLATTNGNHLFHEHSVPIAFDQWVQLEWGWDTTDAYIIVGNATETFTHAVFTPDDSVPNDRRLQILGHDGVTRTSGFYARHYEAFITDIPTRIYYECNEGSGLIFVDSGDLELDGTLTTQAIHAIDPGGDVDLPPQWLPIDDVTIFSSEADTYERDMNEFVANSDEDFDANWTIEYKDIEGVDAWGYSIEQDMGDLVPNNGVIELFTTTFNFVIIIDPEYTTDPGVTRTITVFGQDWILNWDSNEPYWSLESVALTNLIIAAVATTVPITIEHGPNRKLFGWTTTNPENCEIDPVTGIWTPTTFTPTTIRSLQTVNNDQAPAQGDAWDLDIVDSGATIYVSINGNDEGDGSVEFPYLTPQKASNEAVPGDIIEYGPGTYYSNGPPNTNSSYVLNLRNKHGTRENPIIHRAAEGSEVIWDAQGDWSVGGDTVTGGYIQCIIGWESTWHEFHGLTLTGGHSSAVRFYQMAQNITLKNCIIHSNGLFDPNAPGWDDPCDIKVGTGINASPFSMYITIDACTFYNNGRLPYNEPGCSSNHSWRHDHHLYMKGEGYLVQNCVFIKPSAGYSIKCDGGFASKQSVGAHDNYERAFVPDGKNGYFSIIIRNNTFADNLHGLNIEDGTLDTAITFFSNGQIVDDTLVDTEIHNHPHPTEPGLYVEMTPHVLIANNVFYKTVPIPLEGGPRGVGGISQQAGTDGSLNPSTGLFPDSINIISHLVNNVIDDTVKIVQGSHTNLRQEYNVESKESPEIRTPPNLNNEMEVYFVDPDNDDYRILPGHPAIGAAEPLLSPEFDRNGNPRSGTTAGAYEE